MQWNVASAAPPDDPADRAAEDIAEAQERANDAAEAYFEAEVEIDALELEAVDLEARRSRLASKVSRLRRAADVAAVDEFVAAGTRGIPILSDASDRNNQSHAEFYRSGAVNASLEDIDAFEAAELELEALDHEIEDQSAELDDVTETQLELQAEAEAEVVRLREVEEQRLRDEAIRLELERRQGERQRQAEERARIEEQRRQAEQERLEEQWRQAQEEVDEAAATATTTATTITSEVTETTAPAPPPVVQTEDAPETAAEPLPAPPPPSPPPPPPPPVAPPPPPAPLAPPPPPPPPPVSNGIVCPVRGGSAYADTWGAARSQGRSHEGVDMIAPAGTPLVAVTSGRAEMRSASLGGNAVRIWGDNGDYYFYAHLSAYEGSSRQVSQGEVIGYVGMTGNTSVNHLHFEIHPGGGGPINPYPSVVAGGC